MAVLYQIFSTLKTLTILFLHLFLLKIQSLFRAITGSGQRILTTAQFLSYIEESNPAISYTKSRIRLDSTGECAVCLSDLYEGESVRSLKCKHLFHKDCLDKWLQQCRSTCPLCRNKVLPDKVVASYRRLKDDEIEYDYDTSYEREMVFLLSPLHGNGFHGFW